MSSMPETRETVDETSYKIRRIEFGDRSDVAVVLQNQNGPCPLLALVNILSLKSGINLHPDKPQVTVDELVHIVADALLRGSDDATSPDALHAMEDAMTTLPTLQYGMDVNVKFTKGVQGFEADARLAVFDLLRIPLLHGWLLDDADERFGVVSKHDSYNQLVELAVNEDATVDAHVARSFLSETSSQLTYFGLVSLSESVPEGSFGCFFRNNHFNVMHKHEGSLYLLLTDEGYKSQPCLAWERLAAIDGNTELVSPVFGPMDVYDAPTHRDAMNVTSTQTTKTMTDEEFARQLDVETNGPRDGAMTVADAVVAERLAKEELEAARRSIHERELPEVPERKRNADVCVVM